MGKYLQKLKELTREDIIVLLIVLSPFILTIILMLIGEADQRETQRYLESRPQITWREILTSEEQRQMGIGLSDEMDYALQSGQKKRSTLAPGKTGKGMTDFDKEDIYDIIDYNGGLDGEYSDIDYHDMEDYYGD